MATFTMELRKLVEEYDIGLRDYPIFDEDYRDDLNKKILDFYFFHEIGFETPEMFTHQLNQKMRLIMPPMNLMYESTLKDIDPFMTLSLRTVSSTESDTEAETTRESDAKQTATNTAQSQNTSESRSRSVNSQFPQTQLAGNEDYATGAVDGVSDSATGTTATDEALTNATSLLSALDKAKAKGASDTLLSGHSGSQADLIRKFREAIINVDQMVIDQLSDLFMTIVDTADALTPAPMYRRGGMWPLYGGYGYNVVGGHF